MWANFDQSKMGQRNLLFPPRVVTNYRCTRVPAILRPFGLTVGSDRFGRHVHGGDCQLAGKGFVLENEFERWL